MTTTKKIDGVDEDEEVSTREGIEAVDAQTPFEAATRHSLVVIVKFLVDELGKALVLHLARLQDGSALTDYVDKGRTPRAATERRLRTAYQAFLTVSDADSPTVARAWFIGLNPQLGDEAPADAIREDQLRDVLVAARSFAATS